MPSHTRRISMACIILLASITGACADANPTDPGVSQVPPKQPAYSVTGAAWTASGPGTVTVVSDGTAGDAVMSYLLRDNFDEQSWSFTTIATQAGAVTLPWTASGNHDHGSVTVFAVVNGADVAQLFNNSQTFEGVFTYSGTYTFTVNAGDSYGFRVAGVPLDSDLLSGTFTVDLPDNPPSNAAPVLDSIGPQHVEEGSLLSFTAAATDPDAGQTLTYSLVSAPAGASINPATGVFSWTPVDDDPTGTGQDDYTFSVRVTDSGSPAASDEQAVTVTVANAEPVITAVTLPDPIALSGGSATAHISASFTDAGTADTHSMSIVCDESTVVTGPTSPAGVTTVAGDCTYTAAGVYPILVIVNDDDNGGDVDLDASLYVVVYDPDGGFVTGNGWINSPAGAYAADPALAGRANFGFVSKYKKGAHVPDGQTQFRFQAGNLNFSSTAYEWLVIAGARAQYKGTGTINGSGDYGFMLTAIDGKASGGGGVDRFRLRIWDRATDAVVYDNQVGDDPNAAPTTAIGGGSIVIHQ